MGQRSPTNNSFRDAFTVYGVNNAPTSDSPLPDCHCPECPGTPERLNFWKKSCLTKQQMPVHAATCFPICVHKRRTSKKKVKGRSIEDTIVLAEMILNMKKKKIDVKRISKLLNISNTEVLRVLRNRKFFEYFTTGTEEERQRKLQEGFDTNAITENGSFMYREDHRKIVGLYKKGLRKREICKELGIQIEIVRKVLQRVELA